jgi:hypothetical protein
MNSIGKDWEDFTALDHPFKLALTGNPHDRKLLLPPYPDEYPERWDDIWKMAKKYGLVRLPGSAFNSSLVAEFRSISSALSAAMTRDGAMTGFDRVKPPIMEERDRQYCGKHLLNHLVPPVLALTPGERPFSQALMIVRYGEKLNP